MATDFFDEDLVMRNDPGRRSQPEETPADDAEATAAKPSRPVSDFNLTRMARHKEDINSQVAQAMEELELLRTRQEDLEKQRTNLEELRRNQRTYESGKREVTNHLQQSLVTLEKDQMRAVRLVEMLSSTQDRFKNLLAEIEGLDEDNWADDRLEDELTRALALIEDVRLEYNKALSRVDAVSADLQKGQGEHKPMLMAEPGQTASRVTGFGYWLKVGFAVSLPVTLTLVVIAVVFVLLHLGIL